MTTNIMFLRDMKTMTKQDTDGIRCGKKVASENSILKRRKCHTYAPKVPYLAGHEHLTCEGYAAGAADVRGGNGE